MAQEEFTLEGYKHVFRVAKINAIEALALQTQINFDNTDKAQNLFNTILEKIEVKCNDSWIPVKTKERQIYFPPEVETDGILVKSLIEYFMDNFLNPLFQKSGASKASKA